ncbi:hypothetical protein HKD37_15G042220 [Glycine soja]
MFGHYRRALLCFKHNPNSITAISTPFSILLRSFSTSSSDHKQQHSFTLNYLLNTFGFSPETASKLSTRIRLETSHDPDSILSLFKSHGFSDSHIRRIIQTYPYFLSYNARKTILPKLTFLLSKGASTSDLVRIVTKNPRILHFDLHNAITPRYNFIKKFMLSDDSTLRSIKSCPSIIFSNTPLLNIQFLLHNDVPESKVVMLLRYWACSLVANAPTFQDAVREVMELGFRPNKTLFLVALRAKLVRKSLWERKVEVYRKWGWSEEILLSTFLRNPWCMLVSEKKIEAMMEFFITHLGLDSLCFAKHPVLIALSLEKRVVPRASVLQFLLAKGLLKDVNWASAFIVTDKIFLQKFVVSYEKEADQLLKLYEEKRDVPREERC